jgi:spore coat protein U-like protein
VAGPRKLSGVPYLFALGGMLGVCAPLHAGTFVTGAAVVNVSTTIAPSCTITVPVPALDFGTYDPIGTHSATGIDLDVTSIISVACLKQTAATITIDQGSHFSGTRRLLQDTSGDYLAYEIYQPNADGTGCPYATIWGSTAGGYGQTLTPSVTWSALAPGGGSGGAVFPFNVCGRIPKGQNPTMGAGYKDSVFATVTF